MGAPSRIESTGKRERPVGHPRLQTLSFIGCRSPGDEWIKPRAPSISIDKNNRETASSKPKGAV